MFSLRSRTAILLLITLTACTSSPRLPAPAPVTGSPVDPARITGTLTDASFPDGRVLLAAGGTLSTTNAGTLTTPGTVTLPLSAAPDTAELTPLPTAAGSACTYVGDAPTTPTGIGVWDSVAVLSAGGDPLGRITEVLTAPQSGAGGQVIRMYSDRDATLKGTLTCTDRPPQALDVTVSAGWNAVLRPATGGPVTAVPSTARSALRGSATTPAVTLTLDTAGLVFPTSAPVAVRTTFGQVGGYSGRVHLRTDVPGLTVQPATVLLPPLALKIGASALAPQQVAARLTFAYGPTTNIDQPAHVIVTDDAGREVGRATTTVQVTRPGFTLSTRTPDTQVEPSGSTQLPICVSSEGDYSGPVTLGATGLPAGITVTPVTATLDVYTCALVTLNGAGTLRGGSHAFTVTGDGGGYHARLAMTLTALGPAVTLRAASPVSTVYRGGTTDVPVTVSAEYGFTGPTTVTLNGLPTGVTAAPVTVTVPAGGTTTAILTLHATASASLGVTTVTPTGPDALDATLDEGTTLRVRPPRAPVPDGRALSATPGGIWQLTGPATAPATLTRSEITALPLTVTLPGPAERLIAADGSVIAMTAAGTPAAARIQDDGTVIPLPPPPLLGTDDLADRTDATGRVWFVRTSATGPTQISTWIPDTAQVQVIDQTSVTSTYGATVTLSPDRRTVLIVPRYAGVALTIRTDTGGVTPHPLVGGFSSAAVDADGSVWFAGYNTLTHAATRLSNVPTGQLIGFDAAQPGVLWGRDAGNVYRIDTTTGTSVTVQLSDASPLRATLHPAGGLYAVTSDVAGTGQAFLTVLR